jgi:hypothetical protein
MFVVSSSNTSKMQAAMPERRFPPPWSAEEYNDACFIVATTTDSSLPMSISRMSRGADPQPSCSRATRREGSRPISLPELLSRETVKF